MKRRVLGIAALMLLLVAALLLLRMAPQLKLDSLGRGGTPDHVSSYSGVTAVEEIALSSSHGGRIVALHVAQGSAVSEGQLLVTLDTTLLEAQIAVAQARMAVAEAAYRQVEAGARAGTIAVAEAQWERAQAVHRTALQILDDARAMRDDPQESRMQVAVSEIRVEAARQRVASAVALKDAADVARAAEGFIEDQIRNWPYPVSPPQLPQELRGSTYTWWEAWAGVNANEAVLADAEARLTYWRSVLANPQELDAQVALAEAGVEQSAALVDLARATLDGYRQGSTMEQLAAAGRRVDQSQAALNALMAQRPEMAIRAPMDGIVVATMAHSGEVVMPGSTLLSIADLSKVKLTVYVPESGLGKVSLGQKALVVLDAFPQRVFEGQVEQIAGQAEYTPRNVATKEERVNTVYAVVIAMDNADGSLKPGMSADASLMP
jgi:HlyD family secretion protein